MTAFRKVHDFFHETFESMDKTLLLALVAFLGMGLVQVYSSSFIFAVETRGDGLFFFKKQLVFTAVGLIVMIGTAVMPYPVIRRLGHYLWWVAVGMICLTLIPGIGKKAGGAARWIEVGGGFRIEPAELLKISLSLVLANWIGNQNQDKFSPVIAWSKSLLAKRTATLLLPAVLLLGQPDFGTFVILSLVAVTVAFAFGLRWRYLVGAISVFSVAASVLVMTSSYRRARLMSFLDPWADPEKTGFQVIQSLLSFHTGGLTGVGLGQGQGKLFFLPEAHTDFTLAVFGEELGFIGFAGLLLLYFFLVFRSFQIALRTEDRFIRALVIGLALTFAFSVVVNMGVVLGLFPPKGLTLPFMSYGGSSLLAMCFLFGLILSCDIQVQRTTHQERVFFRLGK